MITCTSSRVVLLHPDASKYFCFSASQLFDLELDTVFFSGDFVVIEVNNQERFAIAGPDHFITANGSIEAALCQVIARAVPIE